MILKRHPALDSVFFSNNNLEVHIQSELGEGHIFEFTIKVNDTVIDTQAWAKIDNYNCFADFRGMFDGIFDNTFTSPTVNSMVVKSELLLKKIDINVKEFDSVNEVEVGNEDLPTFYIIKNRTPADFDQSKRIFLMSDVHTLSQIDKDSILMVPVWINTSDPVTISVLDNNGIELYGITNTYEKGLYSFQLLISSLDTSGKSSLKLSFTDGTESILQEYTLKDNFRYKKTQIAIENRFGFYEVVSFFGVLVESPKYKRTAKENYVDVKSVVDDDHNNLYKLSTNYLDSSQTKGLDNFNRTRKSFLFTDEGVRSILITTKNMKKFQTDQFALGNVIAFEDNHLPAINEESKYINN